jgi:protoheme IX farnesyltransferase
VPAPRFRSPPGTIGPVGHWRDFVALTKPRVMSLVIFTGLCGLLAAPALVAWQRGLLTIACIALGAGGAAALNQWWEADLDAGMRRTMKRPLPAGRMRPEVARNFGLLLCVTSVMVMGQGVGWLPAVILTISIVYYVAVYTIWLKPRTPHNIVIGGGAGAFPPLIGWVAATGHVTLMPVLLFAIIFLWTPPHFWSLALFVRSDYARVGIPMLPVVAGAAATRRQIVLYSLVMALAAIAPVLIPKSAGGAGQLYAVAAIALSLIFVVLATRVGFGRSAPVPGESDPMRAEKRLFAFSILFLFGLFAALVVDHWCR